MKFSLYIAKRYLFTKSKSNAINIISIIASAGVIIGSLLLLVFLSGFAGLRTFSLSYSNVIDPDYKILPKNGKRLYYTETQIQALTKNSDILSHSKVIEENVYLQFKNKSELAILKGVDDNYSKTVYPDSILVAGNWIAPKSYQTVSGFLLADKLEMGVFDFQNNLKMYVPKPGKGQLDQNDFNKIISQNVGLFDINEELNQQLLFTSLLASQQLLGYPDNTVSSIELKVADGARDSDLKSHISQIFNQKVLVKNREEQNASMHKMLNTENIFVYLIFTLILIIALFNVIGSIIMMIIDKKKNIKTLYNLGASISDIKQIFFLQGSLLTFIGGTTGVLIGILLIGAQIIFEFVKIPGTNIPYPIELNVKNIILVLVTIYILGIVASKLASYRINAKVLD